ncbi:hypothetical protein LAV84_25730 [Rhizobium sp. VS19-DR104.2]|nr:MULTISPECIES: hypothetical protein [unclassified Rhizobium]MBZ5762947.1 hypothetical protein [Rhizobium sp. VS19-DR96]MBZ5768780.1 hypothetical protein [Rhizobium sp. VS19-DR129.2]MBZ5776396.1 hypothetical protein [Rhizobium sp. VS19-DRK62.2]MBZ5787603.1 hypothetical protein [Rhizobium sp. VS19-DR121]MBZ5804958.1 hypothetical protein [Rhizobium sp. VS19-DR181]
MAGTFAPGEAFQFVLSEDWAIIGSERTELQVAHANLGYSRALVARSYPVQTHEMLFVAHASSGFLRVHALKVLEHQTWKTGALHNFAGVFRISTLGPSYSSRIARFISKIPIFLAQN